MSKKVCVIGEGNWGTAFSTLLAENGFFVNLWCHDPKIAISINEQRKNSLYCSNITLNEKIKGVTNFKDAFAGVEFIFEAIPVKFLREVLLQAKPYYDENQIWAVLSKGIEQDTFFLPSQIIDDVFQSNVKKAVVSGPSFAADLILKQFTSVDVSSSSIEITNSLIKMLKNDYFKPHFSNDMIGMQIAGALKNVITLAIGIAHGKGCSDNAKAYIFTKGLEQICVLTNKLGGSVQTIFGLCGVGDLALSAYGKYSKNLQAGIEIGQGKTILETTDLLPEGINTVRSLHQFIQNKNLCLPLFTGIYEVIFQKKDFSELLKTI